MLTSSKQIRASHSCLLLQHTNHLSLLLCAADWDTVPQQDRRRHKLDASKLGGFRRSTGEWVVCLDLLLRCEKDTKGVLLRPVPQSMLSDGLKYHKRQVEMSKWCVVSRVGQKRIYTPYMTAYLVISLPKLPYIYCTYRWFWPNFQI